MFTSFCPFLTTYPPNPIYVYILYLLSLLALVDILRVPSRLFFVKNEHCKCLQGFTVLKYLLKRAVRITKKPFTPQRGKHVIFIDYGETL